MNKFKIFPAKTNGVDKIKTINSFDENSSEKRQSIVRLWLVIFASIYLLIRNMDSVFYTENIIHIISFISFYFIWSLSAYINIRILPGKYILRRILTMLGDYSALTYAMILGGASMLPLYAVLLWITVGNGLRFGSAYLIFSLIMIQLSLAAVFSLSHNMHLSSDIIITLVLTAAVPTYAYVLLQERERALDEALNANISKSRFLAHASHDLRQPVHAIGLFLTGLRDTPLDDVQKQIVDRIERSLRGLGRLFKSLLDISKLDGGSIQIAPTQISVGDLLKSIVQQNADTARWSGVEMRLVPTQCYILVDATLLTTMVQNLISNAIKYGGKRVLVGVRRRKETLAIEIHDQGDGIASDHLDRIFDEFYRVHKLGDRDTEGIGLGLAIVHRLAQLNDISVEIKSRVDGGTSVYLKNLLLCEPPAQNMVLAEVSNSPGIPLSGMRVILVEDDLDVREATIHLLERWGCIAYGFAHTPPVPPEADVIVTDFDLGEGTTGLDCINDVRVKLSWHIPAIIMTGHDEMRVREAMQDEDIGLLMKPLRPANLRSALSTLRIRNRLMQT